VKKGEDTKKVSSLPSEMGAEGRINTTGGLVLNGKRGGRDSGANQSRQGKRETVLQEQRNIEQKRERDRYKSGQELGNSRGKGNAIHEND